MHKAKLLIVEDERDILRLLTYNFKKQGFFVLTAGSAESGLTLARKHQPDLIIIDIMLPKMDGLEMTRILRQETKVPIIFLTAKKSEMDRILGFKLGADDYVVKPFSVKELVVRVEAVLRRTSPEFRAEATKPVSIGMIEVDLERHEVRVKGQYRRLTPKEFELLKLMIQSKGKVLSRDTLLERIWGHERGVEISTRTVDQHVARLRKKLAPEDRRIATVTNFGYQISTA